MTSQHLLSLADRVEGLDGPDSDVDRAVLAALGYTWRGMAYWFHDDSHIWAGSTHFTASLDDAVTLVPEGWDYCLSQGVGEPATVSLAPNMRVAEIMVEAATMPLALCAASLRAIAGGEG